MTFGGTPTPGPPPPWGQGTPQGQWPQGPPPQGQWAQGPPQGQWAQGSSSVQGTTERKGFVGFMTSLPGVLTAVAALVTAVTGGVGLYLSKDAGPGGDTYNITMDGTAVPQGTAQVDAGALDTGLAAQVGGDEVVALADQCSYDPAACDALFVLLADECWQGYGISCDVLFAFSASGSDYEYYGASCGGRFPDLAYAGYCSEL